MLSHFLNILYIHKTLHHFEALGLLRPARTASGYRRYGDEHVRRLHRILALRQLGIGSVYLSNRDSVLASQEAQDLWRLLEACLAPSDEIKVRSVMATALLGWSAAQLAALNQDELRWEALVEQFRDCARLWQKQGCCPWCATSCSIIRSRLVC